MYGFQQETKTLNSAYYANTYNKFFQLEITFYITRALAEIKMLDKRINKSIHECELVKIKNRGDKWDVEQFNKALMRP